MENDNSDGRTNRRQIALITGSSSGIGFETSLLLARKGIYTYSTMRNLGKSKEILEITKKECLPLKVLTLDVTDEKSTQKAIDMVMYEQNRIDILVNNAGYSLVGALEQISMDEIKEEFETNFFGIIRLIKAIVPIMRKQRSGTIVNISSMVGRFGVPLNAAYVSSKFALEGLSESISFELEEFGIKVILIEPGVVQTDFLHNLKIKGNDAKSPYYKLMDLRIAFLKATINSNVSSSDQVANTILHAVNSNDPALRYVIGNDATNSIHVRKKLPDREFMKWIREGIFHGKGLTR